MTDATRIPVLIGIGEILDRPEIEVEGLDSIGLMYAALRAAEADVGCGILDRLDWLGVEDQISFPDLAPQDSLASLLPTLPKHRVKTFDASGDGPVQLINDAANLIGRGEIALAATVGGEALRTAARRAHADITAGKAPLKNLVAEIAEANAQPLARKHGLLTPIDVYPLYENATRDAWGQTVAEGQAESGEIWSRFSEVAAANPYAWLRRAAPPEQIVTPTADNRMVSFPYTKLMVANSSVNMGAAVIVSSLAMARELGVPDERVVYLGAGAAAYEDKDFLRRDGYTASPSLEATISQALAKNGLTAAALDYVEFYSCFPCIPKMARRLLDWPVNRPMTMYGGLTFGGGPIGNCMMHAVARMVAALRDKGRHGLIVANGGYATHSHSIVLTRAPVPAGTFPQDYIVQAEADALRGPVPELLEDYVGPGSIETYTIPFDRSGLARHATIVALTPAGKRFLARVRNDDAEMMNFLMRDNARPIGTNGISMPGPDGIAIWSRA